MDIWNVDEIFSDIIPSLHFSLIFSYSLSFFLTYWFPLSSFLSNILSHILFHSFLLTASPFLHFSLIFSLIFSPILSYLLLPSFSFHFLFKVIVRAKRQGFSVSEVPIIFVDRIYGESKLGTAEILSYLMYVPSISVWHTCYDIYCFL